jgi:hypothetical protein
VNIIAGTDLLFVVPTANAATLECLEKTPGKGFVGMAIANEARIVFSFIQDNWNKFDELVW